MSMYGDFTDNVEDFNNYLRQSIAVPVGYAGGAVSGLVQGVARIPQKGLADIPRSIGRESQLGADALNYFATGDPDGFDLKFDEFLYGSEGAAARRKKQDTTDTSSLDAYIENIKPFNRNEYLNTPDAELTAQLQNYNNMMARLRPEVNQAKAAVSGAYGAAAGAGRTAAGNIGARGERTAATLEDLYGRAATEAGSMAQAGGTDVSGLTGPSQAFQDIYGGAYNYGTTDAFGTRGQAGLDSESMLAQSKQTAGIGSQASANIERYWVNMTVREQGAFASALTAAKFKKADEFNALEDTVDATVGTLVGSYNFDDDSRKKINKAFNVKNSAELVAYIDNLQEKKGPKETLKIITRSGVGSGLGLGATGG